MWPWSGPASFAPPLSAANASRSSRSVRAPSDAINSSTARGVSRSVDPHLGDDGAAAAAPSSPKCGSTERLTPRAVELLMASLGALTLRELRDALAALNGGANDAGPLQGHTRVLQLYFNSGVWRSIVSEKASTLREREER